MILPILRYPDKRLKKPCAQVTKFDDPLRQLAENLTETMLDAEGAGLAASQIGVMQRVVVVGAKEPLVMVNPVLAILSGGMVEAEEGCLSIPGRTFKVLRWRKARVLWYDIHGAKQKRDFSGWNARIVQHEIDHIRGVLITDRAK